MNKTVTINISGLIFNIDEEAYTKLKKYLATIEGYFKNAEGGNEIMTDIEGRVAEMFSDRISDRKEVISMVDLDSIIATMGQPEDFVDEETKEENARKTQEKKSQAEENQHQHQQYQEYRESETYDQGTRRFYRDPDGRIVGGVCSGIGYYFGVEPIIIRLLFVVTFFTLGGGILIYIILWIITPKANIRAEKLQMKGRKVNIENIKQTVKDEANEVKKKLKNLEGKIDGFTKDEEGKRASRFFYSFISFLGGILKNILAFFGRFLGLILILFSSFWLLFILLSIVGIHLWDGPLTINQNASLLSPGDLNTLIFTRDWTGYFFSIGIGLFIGVPFLLLLIAGAKILFRLKSNNRIVGWGLGGAWLLGIVLIITASATIAGDFKKEEKSYSSFSLAPTFADTVFISVNKSEIPMGLRTSNPNEFINLFKIDKNAKYFSNVKFNVIESKSDSIVISLTQKSRGSSYKEALYKAENLTYTYNISGNEILLDPYFSIPLNEQYRMQEVQLTLAIPVGKTVFLGNGINWVIYDIENVSKTRDREMMGKFWTMTENGLECLHCRFIGTDYYHNNSKDYNEMSLKELENELYDIKSELKIQSLKFESKQNKIRAKFNNKIENFTQRIEGTSDEVQINEYEIQIEKINTKMGNALKICNESFKSSIDELNLKSSEIKSIIETNYSDKKNTKTSFWNGGESEASTCLAFRCLSFPPPFRIIS